MNEVKASMQDNKEWNIIRNDIKNVFDEKDISNRAKEFSDKIANTLTVAKNSLKTTYDKKIKSAKFSREINVDTKIYINSKRIGVTDKGICRIPYNDSICYSDTGAYTDYFTFFFNRMAYSHYCTFTVFRSGIFPCNTGNVEA